MHLAVLLVHPTINGKSHLCPSVIFLKKQLSRLSLSRVVFQLLLPRSSASSSIFFIHLLLLVRRRDSIFFTVLGISASWRFNPFIVLRISSHFCVGLWVWFFFAFLLHLRHSVSSSRYVSPSRCFFFLHCCRRWRKPPLGSCWAVYGSPDP